MRKCKIDWRANIGYCFPAPGTVDKVKCGICGEQMDVKRNVLGATSFAESLAGSKHRHDRYTCPHIYEAWHKRIEELRIDVTDAEARNASDVNKIKRNAEKEILKILKACGVLR